MPFSTCSFPAQETTQIISTPTTEPRPYRASKTHAARPRQDSRERAAPHRGTGIEADRLSSPSKQPFRARSALEGIVSPPSRPQYSPRPRQRAMPKLPSRSKSHSSRWLRPFSQISQSKNRRPQLVVSAASVTVDSERVVWQQSRALAENHCAYVTLKFGPSTGAPRYMV